MNIVDNLIILALVIGSFISGMKISDKYHAQIEESQRYHLRLNATEKGIGYVAPPQMQIGQPFMDRLKATGRATQKLKRSSRQ